MTTVSWLLLMFSATFAPVGTGKRPTAPLTWIILPEAGGFDAVALGEGRPEVVASDLGEQDHGQPSAWAAQAAQHLPAIWPRHQHVQHASVWVEPLHQLQRRVAVRGHVHRESGPFEEWRQIGRDRTVVVG
jgi:hypothetical protein